MKTLFPARQSTSGGHTSAQRENHNSHAAKSNIRKHTPKKTARFSLLNRNTRSVQQSTFSSTKQSEAPKTSIVDQCQYSGSELNPPRNQANPRNNMKNAQQPNGLANDQPIVEPDFDQFFTNLVAKVVTEQFAAAAKEQRNDQAENDSTSESESDSDSSSELNDNKSEPRYGQSRSNKKRQSSRSDSDNDNYKRQKESDDSESDASNDSQTTDDNDDDENNCNDENEDKDEDEDDNMLYSFLPNVESHQGSNA